jgi:hypothetical protein
VNPGASGLQALLAPVGSMWLHRPELGNVGTTGRHGGILTRESSNPDMSGTYRRWLQIHNWPAVGGVGEKGDP